MPLHERGIEVHGIDASEAMVAKLRAKPGGGEIPVTIGDFSEVAVEGTFSLVFVTVSTFTLLPSREAQIRCFENVAKHLQPGGLFVVDSDIQDFTKYPNRQRLEVWKLEPDQVDIFVAQWDPATARIKATVVAMTEQGIRLTPMPFRPVWPSELDLMARIAGLRLRERAGGWHDEPFTEESDYHVSIYELPA